MTSTGINFLDDPAEKALLKQYCAKAKIPFKALEDMIKAEFDAYGKAKRRNLLSGIEEHLDLAVGDQAAEFKAEIQ